FVSVGINYRHDDFTGYFGCIDRNKNVHRIANELREFIFADEVAGCVIGLPPENPEHRKGDKILDQPNVNEDALIDILKMHSGIDILKGFVNR
ncbi:hypothetical protein Dsin_000493, partial [Dipteronia sinensis]